MHLHVVKFLLENGIVLHSIEIGSLAIVLFGLVIAFVEFFECFWKEKKKMAIKVLKTCESTWLWCRTRVSYQEKKSLIGVRDKFRFWYSSELAYPIEHCHDAVHSIICCVHIACQHVNQHFGNGSTEQQYAQHHNQRCKFNSIGSTTFSSNWYLIRFRFHFACA